jgi:hypothetical protein
MQYEAIRWWGTPVQIHAAPSRSSPETAKRPCEILIRRGGSTSHGPTFEGLAQRNALDGGYRDSESIGTSTTSVMLEDRRSGR